MKQRKKRLLSVLLAFAVALAFAPMVSPPAAAAGNYVVSLTDVGLDNNQAEIQDALDDTINNYDMVTVIGNAEFRDTLNIRIPTGKKVVWQADLVSTAVGRAINITGAGDFEVVSGGVIKADSGNAIYVTKGNVSISGTGRVEAGAGNGYAITIAEEGIVTMSQWASITTAGNAISNIFGIVLLSENAKIVGGICIRAYSVMISGGSIMSTGDAGTPAILCEKGLITVTGGTVTSSSEDGAALKSSQGSITITGGSVTAAGIGGTAVYCVQGATNITGGSVRSVGDGGSAIYCAEGLLTVSDGIIEAAGTPRDADGEDGAYETRTDGTARDAGNAEADDTDETDNADADAFAGGTRLAAAIVMGPGGVARIINGEVKATGKDGFAIAAEGYGAAVYLKNKVTAGAFFADDSAPGYASGDNGMIIEVDSLSVPVSRNGSNDGLTRKAGGGAAVWDMSGNTPKISLLLANGVKREIEWGAKLIVSDIQMEAMNYVRGYGINLVTVVQKDFSLFRNVRMDGVSITRDSDYKAEESPTMITLFATYLDTLPVGDHNLAIGFTDGSTAYATVTVISIWVNPFTDVPANAWYFNDVRVACQSGLIAGRTPTTFAPGENLTYAEAVKLAACMHQLYTTGAITLENAVAPDQWYQSYVDYCNAFRIISREFEWNDAATRSDYIEIFASALPNDAFTVINRVPNGAIPDVPMDHPQAAAIYKMYRAGIVEGSDSAHNCWPDSNIVRREVAAILTRMMDDTARKIFELL